MVFQKAISLFGTAQVKTTGRTRYKCFMVTSFLQKLHRMSFSLNSGMCFGISFGSEDSRAYVTIHNGNVDEIEKHPQTKSEFAFTIQLISIRFLIENINTTHAYALYILIIFGHHTGVFVVKPLVCLSTFDVPSIPSLFVANKRSGLLSNRLQQMAFSEN